MKALKLSITLCLLGLAPTSAQAADTDGRFAVRGMGTNKCSVLSGAIEKKDAASIQLYSSWLAGYLSASNRLISQTFDAVPAVAPSDALGLVAVLCRRSADALVESAAYQSLVALNAIRVREDSPLVVVKGAGAELAIRQSVLSSVQTGLAALGLFKGKPDGKTSAEFVRAVQSFKKPKSYPRRACPTSMCLSG
jgi:hypothetical protein